MQQNCVGTAGTFSFLIFHWFFCSLPLRPKMSLVTFETQVLYWDPSILPGIFLLPVLMHYHKPGPFFPMHLNFPVSQHLFAPVSSQLMCNNVEIIVGWRSHKLVGTTMQHWERSIPGEMYLSKNWKSNSPFPLISCNTATSHPSFWALQAEVEEPISTSWRDLPSIFKFSGVNDDPGPSVTYDGAILWHTDLQVPFEGNCKTPERFWSSPLWLHSPLWVPWCCWGSILQHLWLQQKFL